jgi:hypothetical protein
MLGSAAGLLTAPALAAADAAASAVAAAALTALAAAFASAVPALTACLAFRTWVPLVKLTLAACCSNTCRVQETQSDFEGDSHLLMSWL